VLQTLLSVNNYAQVADSEAVRLICDPEQAEKLPDTSRHSSNNKALPGTRTTTGLVTYKQ